MTWIALLSASIAPGIALLTYFYLKDRYETEPIRVVIKVFLFGVLLVFPTMVLQRGFMIGLGENDVIFAFIISGGIEEFLKWFVLFFTIYHLTVFDEPYDGIVYAVAISIGFATLENILYAFFYPSTVMSLFMRGLLPVSGHALFGVIMGYYLGKAKFSKHVKLRRRYVVMSLLVPIFWHGLYDYILLGMGSQWMLAIVPFMVFLWVRSLWNVQSANDKSPFRSVKGEEELRM